MPQTERQIELTEEPPAEQARDAAWLGLPPITRAVNLLDGGVAGLIATPVTVLAGQGRSMRQAYRLRASAMYRHETHARIEAGNLDPMSPGQRTRLEGAFSYGFDHGWDAARAASGRSDTIPATSNLGRYALDTRDTQDAVRALRSLSNEIEFVQGTHPSHEAHGLRYVYSHWQCNFCGESGPRIVRDSSAEALRAADAGEEWHLTECMARTAYNLLRRVGAIS